MHTHTHKRNNETSEPWRLRAEGVDYVFRDITSYGKVSKIESEIST